MKLFWMAGIVAAGAAALVPFKQVYAQQAPAMASVNDAIIVVERLCLVGERYQFRMNADGNLSIRRQGAQGGLSIESTRTPGGAFFRDENVTTFVEAQIRTCMSQNWEKVSGSIVLYHQSLNLPSLAACPNPVRSGLYDRHFPVKDSWRLFTQVEAPPNTIFTDRSSPRVLPGGQHSSAVTIQVAPCEISPHALRCNTWMDIPPGNRAQFYLAAQPYYDTKLYPARPPC